MIKNVHAKGAILTSSITGIPGHPVEDVTLSKIRIETEEGGKKEWLARPVSEQEKSYPEARMFGRLPSYGIYRRHVSGLTLDQLHLTTTVPDERPAGHCEDVKELHLDRLDATPSVGDQPLAPVI
jgi:hypothetical protein